MKQMSVILHYEKKTYDNRTGGRVAMRIDKCPEQ